MPGEINAKKETEKPDPIFRWIDSHDIMMRLHISMRTLQSWRSNGWLPYSRIGKKIFYLESDLNDLLTKNLKARIKESQSNISTTSLRKIITNNKGYTNC